MLGSETKLGSVRPWLVAAILSLSVSAALAQEPSAGARDDVNGTMRILVDPNATEPTEIVRKISAAKSKRTNKSTDSTGKDLASPGKDEDEGSGSPAPDPAPDTPDTNSDPGTPAAPGTPAPPDAPVDTGHGNSQGPGGGHGPDVGRPDPGEHGHDISDDAKHRGEEARQHHDSPGDSQPPGKPPKPRGPDHHPPAPPEHPAHPPHPDHPQVKPPRGPRGPGPG